MYKWENTNYKLPMFLANDPNSFCSINTVLWTFKKHLIIYCGYVPFQYIFFIIKNFKTLCFIMAAFGQNIIILPFSLSILSLRMSPSIHISLLSKRGDVLESWFSTVEHFIIAYIVDVVSCRAWRIGPKQSDSHLLGMDMRSSPGKWEVGASLL